MSAPIALRLNDVVKTYPGVVALKNVSFDVRAGEVHAIVGENGAGKSTLMGVACGAVTPDQGVVEIDGEVLRRPSPALARRLGIAVVYQHASVLDDLTVAENILYASGPGHRPGRRTTAWVREHLDAVGANARPGDRVSDLTVAQRQLVEIARALASEAKVLVLDEPTESLTAAETELLFEQIRELRGRGAGIVYISHRFGEVRRIADRITVLRDGESRGTFDAAEVSEEDVVTLIVGREVSHVFPPKTQWSEHPDLLVAHNLSGGGFTGVTVSVRAGEILGMAGVEGNGQSQFLRALGGLGRHTGRLEMTQTDNEIRGPGEAIDSGVVYLPADRHGEGAFLPMTVRENVSGLRHRALSAFGVLNRRREAALATDFVTTLGVRTPTIETPMSSLSGGNQQKVVIARSLAAEPAVLLADEPTRGVDVGARSEIYGALREFADSGHGAAVVSSDAVELAGLCDRVLVFSRGRVVRELTGDELTERGITGAAITASGTHSPARVRRALPAVFRGDQLPSGVLAVLIVALGIYTTARNSLFFGERSLFNLLLLGSIVGLVALGELTTLLVGSIDLSVGPLIGLTIVTLSFFADGSKGMGGLFAGVVVAALVGVAVGALNSGLISGVRLPPVVATLVTYILLQGVALQLRPQPNGYLDPRVTELLQRRVGTLPGALVLLIVIAVIGEVLLRRTRGGIALRAVGSDETRARQVGAPVVRTHLKAHVLCSLAAVLAGMVLASVVGVGDASVGSNYTLTSIAAVVLGGASIFGGRGSYIGAALGALLLQEITSATTFLHLPEAWQEWLPGLLIIFGAAIFSRRGRRRETAEFG
jgi:ribose transport system ATP-binding protein